MESEPDYPSNFSASIDMLNQHISTLMKDCAAVASGALAERDFFETISAVTDALITAKQSQSRLDETF